MNENKSLMALARACGLCTSYHDMNDEIVTAPAETLKTMIGLLRPDLLRDGGTFYDLLRKLKQEALERQVPSYIVQWGDDPAHFWLWAPIGTERIDVKVIPQAGGTEQTCNFRLNDLTYYRRRGAMRIKITLPRAVEEGYYTIVVNFDDQRRECFLIAAPSKLEDGSKSWGLFAPTHALPSANGLGGFSELEEAARLVANEGGSFIGILPLLAAVYEGAGSTVSPYSPASRLFYNEIYLGLDDLPGGEKADLSAERSELKKLADEKFVPYEKIYEVKRRAIAKAARALRALGPDKAFEDFIRETPHLEEFAEMTGGKDEDGRFSVLYAQYCCHLALTRLKERGRKGEIAGLYMDFPVGANGGGFDAKRFPSLFLQGCKAGSPPDLFFQGGQNWGFEPFHPPQMAADEFRYFRQALATVMRYSTILRIDHIMGLFRIYCVPDEASPKEGVYLYLPFDGLMAVLCLEAKRFGVTLVGEDLGTVSPVVRGAMEQRGLVRMWLMQFEAKADKPLEQTIEETVTPNMIASFNSHDSYPFDGFRKGMDIEKFHELGVLDDEKRDEEMTARQAIVRSLSQEKDPYRSNLKKMAASPARFAMISIDDLLERMEPQNIPGTDAEYPNWKIRFSAPPAGWPDAARFNNSIEILNESGRKRP